MACLLPASQASPSSCVASLTWREASAHPCGKSLVWVCLAVASLALQDPRSFLFLGNMLPTFLVEWPFLYLQGPLSSGLSLGSPSWGSSPGHQGPGSLCPSWCPSVSGTGTIWLTSGSHTWPRIQPSPSSHLFCSTKICLAPTVCQVLC